VHVIGVCPNCHSSAHYSNDKNGIKRKMHKRVAMIEKRLRLAS
jgi:predicted HNH restriction endonuclease